MKTGFVLMLVVTVMSFGISFNINPVCDPGDVLIDTVFVDGVEYHKIILDSYPLMITGSGCAGLPSLPYIVKTFLLPPDTEISDLTVSHEKWTALPGKYYLYPAQGGMMGDTAFILPDSLIYAWETPFPEEPVDYPSQGSALGYSVVTLTGTPVRYTPADSLVEVLTRMRVSFDLIPSASERISPLRETELSAEVRQMNILGLVANPELISLYDSPEVVDRSNNFAGLNVFDAPSPEGDGVDMVIITSGPSDAGSDLTGAFQELADYRTAQGIITVVRTIGWIENTYSGCDTPQKIRNFIRDAHENWGVQGVILGGDDWIVPVRHYHTGAWNYYAADDYYADIDGNWVYDDDFWSIEGKSAYVDLLVGRLPVDDSEDIQTIIDKIVTYETQPDNSAGFCRSFLLMGSDGVLPGMVSNLRDLKNSLVSSGAIPDYLNTPLELYWNPNERPPLESFTRSNVLQAFDTGYNVAIHCDHSDIHEIGAGGDPHLSIYDYDFGSMGNQDRTGILWTMGCSPGSFVEAECFAEAGLLTDSETGFVAVMANTTLGSGYDWKWSQSFCDALYSTDWTQWEGQMPVNWPLSYLGQAFRHQKNFKPTHIFYDDDNSVKHHFFGDPFIFVWRDSPSALTVSPTPSSGITTGIQTISVLVTELDMGYPVPVYDATVCIWSVDRNDVFALGRTNSSGVVIFADLEISQTGELSVTATKRRDGFDVAAYLPDTETITVTEAPGALVCLDYVVIDDDNNGSSQGSDDGVINPGETIEFDITAVNNGSSAANYVTAELNVVSGAENIANIPTSQISFPNIPSEASSAGNSPFVVTVNENVESYSSIEFEIEFFYNFNQTWESPYCCSIFSESYSIPLVDINYSQSSTQVTIDMSDFLLVNSGTGTGLDLEMTVSDIYPSEPFICNTIENLGALSPDEYIEIGSQITLVITPDNPSTSPWTNQSSFDVCIFDIQIAGNGGEFAAKRVDFNLVRNPGEIGAPGPPNIIEADDSSLEFEWGPGSTEDLIGFYVYYKKQGSSSNMTRSTSLPIPVGIGQISSLDPGTQYIVDVTAVNVIGRESGASNEVLSTTCEVSDGWPVQLEGGTGTGPVIVNMDSDAEKEIVVASSFGNVYIIQSDGQTECIPPPSSLDFDRFVSLSVGDVDNDGSNEIVVSCQLDIVDGEVAVLIYDETGGGIWQRNILDDTIGPNETVCGASATGTPVILQANDSSTLEIALRTKGSSTALHMWRWDTGLLDWVEPNGFPISLCGDFFAEPIAVDFDDDGYDELIVSQVVNNYSTLHVVDFYSGGFSEYDIQLTELGTAGRVYSTLAAVEYGGEVYITGVAKYSDYQKKIFVYDITAPNTGMIWYSSNMQSGEDFMGNMGGPAIGYANTDAVPDIFYALDGMSAWQLLSEEQISNTGQMSINIHSGIMNNVKSATITAGATPEYSNVTVPFVGFSSKFYGHDPLNYMNVLPGFPTWTETPSWTAPVVGDVDNDGFFEVLTADASGELTLYDWNGYSTSNCWPMYQHDPHRTGFFNSGRSGNEFDIELVEANLIQVVGGNAYDLLLAVKVVGSRAIQENQTDFEANLDDSSYPEVQATEFVESCLRSNNRIQSRLMNENTQAVIIAEREIPIVVFSGRDVVGTLSIPLVNGLHESLVTLAGNYLNNMTVVIDPWNRFRETDETNNSHSVETEATGSFSEFSVSLQSPSDMISATVVVPDGYTTGISFTLYSLDGRLQSSSMTELLIPGTHRIDLFSGGEGGKVPSGMYLVHINIADKETMIRKVVVL